MSIGFVIAGLIGVGIAIAILWGAYKSVEEAEEERKVRRKLAELLGIRKVEE